MYTLFVDLLDDPGGERALDGMDPRTQGGTRGPKEGPEDPRSGSREFS